MNQVQELINLGIFFIILLVAAGVYAGSRIKKDEEMHQRTRDLLDKHGK